MSCRFSRSACASALLALLGSACGGSEFTSGGAALTNDASAGSGNGGADGSGGASGATGSGGTGGTGNTSGSGGVIGASGGTTSSGGFSADAEVADTGVGSTEDGGRLDGGIGGAGGDIGTGGAGTGGVVGTGGAGGAGGVVGTGGAGGAGTGGTGGCANPATWYPDKDGDTYGVTSGAVESCSSPANKGWAVQGGDCDDGEPDVHPQLLAAEKKYFTMPYSKSAGGDSYDYDCSGTEDGNPAQTAEASSCATLSLGSCASGTGFAPTSRKGTGLNSFCGSVSDVTCTGLIVACGSTTKTVSSDQAYGCR